jgi:ribosomal protein L14E/L6E/L27E
MQELVVGQVVRSAAGRDKGHFMVIVDVLDEEYVMLCDGRKRKVASPKKKKVKHLRKTNTVFFEVCEKLDRGLLTDAEIRKKIADCFGGKRGEEG